MPKSEQALKETNIQCEHDLNPAPWLEDLDLGPGNRYRDRKCKKCGYVQREFENELG